MAETTMTQSPTRLTRRGMLVLLGVLIVIPVTYALAWWDAYRLTNRYMDDAAASYADERYLDALLGYEAFDDDRREYVTHGGYIQVRRIWQNDYAWPVPDDVEHAEARIEQIIDERLTIEDAETFVQTNIGRNNPFMGIIYLRLGELYEADGQLREAEDIYASIPDLFANDRELIERAREDLERLQAHQDAE